MSFLITQKKVQPSHLKNFSYRGKIIPWHYTKTAPAASNTIQIFPWGPSPTPQCAAGRATNVHLAALKIQPCLPDKNRAPDEHKIQD